MKTHTLTSSLSLPAVRFVAGMLLVTIAGVLHAENIILPANIQDRKTENVNVKPGRGAGATQLTIKGAGVTVARGTTMKISAGVNVEFVPENQDNMTMTFSVDGTLEAKGTSDKPILFRGYAGPLSVFVTRAGVLKADNTIFKDMNIVIADGELRLTNCILDNCSIKYDGSKKSQSIVLKNCTIKNNIVAPAVFIMRVETAPVIEMKDVKITGNKKGGLVISARFALDSERPLIKLVRCDIFDNGEFNMKWIDSKNVTLTGLYFGSASQADIMKTIVRVPKDDRPGRVIIVDPSAEPQAAGAPALTHPALKKPPQGTPPFVKMSWAKAAAGGGEATTKPPIISTPGLEGLD